METSSSLSTARADALLVKAEDFARTEPTKAVVSAFGAGLLIHLLPIGKIVVGLSAVALTLVRPFLLVLGVIKAYEVSRQQGVDNSDV